MKIFSIDIASIDIAESAAGYLFPTLLGDSALLPNGKPLFIPEGSDEVLLSPALVLRLTRVGKTIAPRFAHRYATEAALGVCASDPVALRQARSLGQPETTAFSFDGAAPVGAFGPLSPDTTEICARFTLATFGAEERGEALLNISADTIWRAVAGISRRFTVKTGDLIFLCDPRLALNANMNMRLAAQTECGISSRLTFNVK